MEILGVLTDPILPVFAVLVLGYAMGAKGWMTDADARVINRLAMTVLLPALIFGMVAEAPIRSFAVMPLIIYGAVELVVFLVSFAIVRVMGAGRSEAILLALSAVFANTAFVVIPISVLMYGAEAILRITAIVTWDIALLFPATMVALEVVRQGPGQLTRVLPALLRSPLILAATAGLALNLMALPLPGPLQTFVGFTGIAAAPVGLFALGVILSGVGFRGDRVVTFVSGVQLVLFPALVWLALAVLVPLEPGLALFVLGAAGPCSTGPFSLALLNGIRTDRIAQVLIWTAVFSPLVLAALA